MMETNKSQTTDWLSQDWTPVKFITLTDRNGRAHDEHIEDVKRFFTVFGWRLGVHCRVLVGGDSKWNVHSHGGLLIHNTELTRYEEKLHRFARSRVWEWKTCNGLGFQDWNEELAGENGWKTFDYLMKQEHDYQAVFSFCPKKKSACRKGNCPHHGNVHHTLS